MPLPELVRFIAPGATLCRTWPLSGGISAESTAFEIALPTGERVRYVLRRPVQGRAKRDFQLLEVLAQLGVAVPQAILVDEGKRFFPYPTLLIEYIEGKPVFAPVDVDAFVRQCASALAAIHRVKSDAIGARMLETVSERVLTMLAKEPHQLDETILEGRIRTQLDQGWPGVMANRSTVLHGDFWPGNLIWLDGQLNGVIDWEDACLGDPVADVAIARLDLYWLAGKEAMTSFTRAYMAANPIDFSQLPWWDLCAALRPASRLAEWVAGYQDLGRHDMTVDGMAQVVRDFAADASRQL